VRVFEIVNRGETKLNNQLEVKELNVPKYHSDYLVAPAQKWHFKLQNAAKPFNKPSRWLQLCSLIPFAK